MIDEGEGKYGRQSKAMTDLISTMNRTDLINLQKVTSILDTYGWLGSDKVGVKGNSTLFLVIQHGDLPVQEKYLPMMRDAVKAGNARGADLALLEDRIALRQGKKQIYGSQVQTDLTTGKYFIAPIEDEPNVNKRMASVGLEPLEDYVRRWNIEYKIPLK